MRQLNNLLRMLSHLSIGSSIVCFAAAALAFASVPDAAVTTGALRFRTVHVSLGDIPPGAEIPADFTVTNECSKSTTLLGVSQFCAEWGCVYASRFPITLAPNACETFSVHVRTRKPGQSGEFATEVILYTDAPGSGQIELSIAGKILPVPEG
jgi:hypothetical protein